jgi:hypothetical protein
VWDAQAGSIRRHIPTALGIKGIPLRQETYSYEDRVARSIVASRALRHRHSMSNFLSSADDAVIFAGVCGTDEEDKMKLVAYLFPLFTSVYYFLIRRRTSMGTITEISNNLLRISKGDVSLYERTTSTFERRVGSERFTDSAPPVQTTNTTPTRTATNSE